LFDLPFILNVNKFLILAIPLTYILQKQELQVGWNTILLVSFLWSYSTVVI